MRIKSQKDFFSGLMFLLVGGGFAAVAVTNYTVGSAARMGPGYFPMLLGGLLALLGAAVMFSALTFERRDDERIGAIAWRPLFFVLVGVLTFGLLLTGTRVFGMKIPGFGLYVCVFILVGISSLADRDINFKKLLMGLGFGIPLSLAGIFGVRFLESTVIPGTKGFALQLGEELFIATTVGLFIYALLLMIAEKLAKKPAVIAVVVAVALGVGAATLASPQATASAMWVSSRVVTAVALFFVVLKVVPNFAGGDTSEIKFTGLFVSTILFIAVWAFIDGLKLQFPLWPTFLTA
jgi:hypothetical protein